MSRLRRLPIRPSTRGRSRRWLALVWLAAGAMLAVLANPPRAWAQPPLDSPPPGGVYVFGVENIAYLPYYSGAEGRYEGFARRVFDAFARDLDLAVQYMPLPVPRLYASLAAGKVDLKFPDNPLWRPDFREQRALFYSDPVVDYVDGTLVLAGADKAGIEDIRTLGTVTGFTAWPWMDRITAGQVTVVENTSFESLIRQVMARRVDAAYANVDVVRRLLAETFDQPDALVFDPHLPMDRGSYLLSSLTQPTLIADFNNWMRANARDLATLKASFGLTAGAATDGGAR